MPAAEARLVATRDGNNDGKVSPSEAEAHALRSGTYTGVVKEADNKTGKAISREEAKAYFTSKKGPAR